MFLLLAMRPACADARQIGHIQITSRKCQILKAASPKPKSTATITILKRNIKISGWRNTASLRFTTNENIFPVPLCCLLLTEISFLPSSFNLKFKQNYLFLIKQPINSQRESLQVAEFRAQKVLCEKLNSVFAVP